MNESNPTVNPAPHRSGVKEPRVTVVSQKIPLSQIRPDPTQGRSTFDPEQIEQLKESMSQRGLINPISLRQAGEGFYEIIAGERRYRAATLLGWTEIDARVWPADTPTLETELLSLVENLQRVDLNPIEEARGYKQLAEPPYDMTQEQIAQEVGKDRSVIARFLSLLDLPPDVQEIVARATISVGHIRSLKQISDPQELTALAKRAEQEGWSIKETERQVNELLGKSSRKEGPEAKSVPSGSTKLTTSEPDPLAEMWPPLQANPAIAPQRTWSTRYKGNLTWVFEVHATSLEAKQYLADWFTRVGQGLGAQGVSGIPSNQEMAQKMQQAEEEEKRQEAIRHKPTPAELAGKMRFPTSVSRSPHFGGRRPNGDKEMEEVEAAAKSGGPAAVYRWVYGPDSSMAQMMEGTSWKDMGFSDPAEGCRKLLEMLRGSQGPGTGEAGSYSKGSQEPQEKQEEDSIDDLDPETREMVMRQVKLGRLL